MFEALKRLRNFILPYCILLPPLTSNLTIGSDNFHFDWVRNSKAWICITRALCDVERKLSIGQWDWGRGRFTTVHAGERTPGCYWKLSNKILGRICSNTARAKVVCLEHKWPLFSPRMPYGPRALLGMTHQLKGSLPQKPALSTS